MKKLLALAAAVLGITILVAGCISLPKHVNLSGSWEYSYGIDLQDKGSITLSQNNTSVTGIANNVHGQYKITGKVIRDIFCFEGKSDKDEFAANCSITSGNGFEGTYNSISGIAGKIDAHRK